MPPTALGGTGLTISTTALERDQIPCPARKRQVGSGVDQPLKLRRGPLLGEGSLAAPVPSSHGAPCLAFPPLAALGHTLAPLLSLDQETLRAAPPGFTAGYPARRPLFLWLPNPIHGAKELLSCCSVTESTRGEVTEGKRSKNTEDRASSVGAGHHFHAKLGAEGSPLAEQLGNKCVLTSRTGSAVN